MYLYLKIRLFAPSLQALRMVITASNGCFNLRSESLSKTLNEYQKHKEIDSRRKRVSRQGFRNWLTWANCRVCSRTNGLRFFSTFSIPRSMCSTNRERAWIRRHLCLNKQHMWAMNYLELLHYSFTVNFLIYINEKITFTYWTRPIMVLLLSP